MNPIVVLTVAGSDSGAGAGIQVDLKTIAAHSAFGVSAVTAVTVQNTSEVRAVHAIPASLVAAQIDCLLDDFQIAAVKTGMLANAETVEAVAEVLEQRAPFPVVVDPVMISSTGTRLLDEPAVRLYRERLFPLATVVTPNLGEASVLVARPILSIDDMETAGREITSWGAQAVLVKGGHLRSSPMATDLLVATGGTTTFDSRWIDSPNVHGTGCTLSAALACRLARNEELSQAVRGAKEYVHRCIAGAAGWSLGSGHGPLDHFGWGLSTVPPGSIAK